MDIRLQPKQYCYCVFPSSPTHSHGGAGALCGNDFTQEGTEPDTQAWDCDKILIMTGSQLFGSLWDEYMSMSVASDSRHPTNCALSTPPQEEAILWVPKTVPRGPGCLARLNNTWPQTHGHWLQIITSILTSCISWGTFPLIICVETL